MNVEQFVRRVWFKAPAEEVFAWHARPGAFERLSAPWERVEVIEGAEGIEDGAQAVLHVRLGPFRLRWTLEHQDYVAGQQFCDVQIEGPFPLWKHVHRIVPEGAQGCYLEDRIDYALPLGPVGKLLGGWFVRRKLDRLFAYRHRRTVQDLTVHRRYRDKGGHPMKVLVSGSSGLVGSALVPFLTTGGHEVVRLVRSDPGEAEVRWDPEAGSVDTAGLEGLDAVVHLAGENIAAGRWTEEKKQRIRDSRVEGTRLLCETLAGLEQPPRALVCASAMGYYGDRGDEVLTEESDPGSGFLPEVCREWEAAAGPAAEAGIRVVNLRFGIILSPEGGALAKMLFPFRMGAGGRLGSGDQYMSWISLDDAVGAIHHALATETLEGPVNGVGPQPVTNAEYTKTLGRVLVRPTIFPMPAFAARLAFGEMADALLLSSARLEPARLQATGYAFQHPELEGALKHLLGK